MVSQVGLDGDCSQFEKQMLIRGWGHPPVWPRYHPASCQPAGWMVPEPQTSVCWAHNHFSVWRFIHTLQTSSLQLWCGRVTVESVSPKLGISHIPIFPVPEKRQILEGSDRRVSSLTITADLVSVEISSRRVIFILGRLVSTINKKSAYTKTWTFNLHKLE